jgi:integrase
MECLKTISRDQWRYAISALKDFWKNGLRMDWPEADVKAFVGRLPPTGRNFAPRDHVVSPWCAAIEKEPDIYRKMIVILVADFGYRPDHLYKLKMEDLQTDENGNLDAIVADGNKRKFKTDATVATYLPPEVRTVLKEFNEKVGGRRPNDSLIPYRRSNGRIELSRSVNGQVLYREWHRFERTWALPSLNPNAFRHFVCRTCESVGLSKSASGYLVGHDTRQGETYRNWYANLDVEEALEEQRRKIPNGVMGLIRAPKVDLAEEIPSQLLSLCLEFIEGKIGDLDFASKAGIIRTQMVAEEPKRIEP